MPTVASEAPEPGVPPAGQRTGRQARADKQSGLSEEDRALGSRGTDHARCVHCWSTSNEAPGKSMKRRCLAIRFTGPFKHAL